MEDAEYRERMQRKKAAIDRRIAAASNDKGLLVALVGDGMGKSSSAYGMAARALGHNLHCAIARFEGGAEGETAFLRECVNVHLRDTDTPVTPEWIAGCLSDEDIHVVILDGIDRALEEGLLDADGVAHWLANRPPFQHVIVTGRHIPEGLLDQADTITEMRDAKQVLDTVGSRETAE